MNTGVTAQVEVEFSWMCDADIDGGAGRNVESFSDLILLVNSEETSVVTFLNSDEGDSWLVTTFEHHASLSDRPEFALENVQELAFTDTVTVEDDSSRLEASVAVKLDEQFTDHVGEIGNDLMAVLLDSDSSGISGRMGVHGPDDGSDRRFAGIPGRRVGDVSPQEDDRLTEDSWTDVGQENGVHSSELDIHLQAQIGKSLWGSLDHILGLDALCGNSENSVTDTFHFG